MMMRWEKTGDFNSVFRTVSNLRIPAEGYYRWKCLLAKKKVLIPKVERGLESFLAMLFIGLINKKQAAEEAKLLVELFTHVIIAQCNTQVKMDQKAIDRVLYYFWNWQHHFNPGTPRPQTESVDELVEQMEQLKKLFDQSAGIAVKAQDLKALLR